LKIQQSFFIYHHWIFAKKPSLNRANAFLYFYRIYSRVFGKEFEPLQIKIATIFISFYNHINNYRAIYLRGEGDSNSRGRKTNGLAIHRRAGLGHPRIKMGNETV
jgi:hypothetical protein